MPHSLTPLVDENNPCYCPDEPASAYLERLRSASGGGALYIPTFSQLFDEAKHDTGNLFKTARSKNVLLHESSLDIYDLSLSTRRQLEGVVDAGPVIPKRRRSSSLSETFSDMEGPAKRERSSQSINDDSFQLSGKATRIRTFHPPTFGHSPSASSEDIELPAGPLATRKVHEYSAERRLHKAEEELYGPPIGTETPRGLATLIARLQTLLPGIRLKERLYALSELSHQSIADFLANEGLLNAAVLDILRTSEIWRLDLASSMLDELGLNLSGSDVLKVLRKPNAFLFLVEINFSDTPLCDYDLVHVHHLPRLASLLLSNTGIGNEAIFHLVSLKRTLKQLYLEENPRIDDDAAPALLTLARLRFVSLIGTSLGMAGLRRLASIMYEENRPLDIAVPYACEEYINAMHTQYAIQPQPPLITDPAACGALSTAGLRRNLAVHTAHNPDVVPGGSKGEMRERLERILTIRRGDMLVRAMMWGTEEAEAEGGAEGAREREGSVEG